MRLRVVSCTVVHCVFDRLGSTLDSILAAAAPALINILQIAAIADGQPVNAGLAAKVNADAALIKTLAGDFAQTSAASAPGVCQQLQSAIGAYQSDQQLVLQLAQVSDPNTQTKITLLSNLVAGTVEAITAVIPSCQNAASKQTFKAAPPSSALLGHGSLQQRSNRSHGERGGRCSATPKLKLYRHSKLVRSMTFGLLQ